MPPLPNQEESPSPSEAPQLSIAVASTRSGRDAVSFLQSLAKQVPGPKIEIIIAHCGGDEGLGEITRTHLNVTLLCFPDGTNLPTLWGAAIAKAGGQIIAVTEATCIPDSNWIASIIKAHELPDPVIGGAVEVARCDTLLDWAAYFSEYGQFLLPLKEDVATELAGNNLSFKRWAMDVGAEMVRPEFWKTYWCRRLQVEGIGLKSTPTVVVYYQKSYRLLPFLVRKFHHGRCFAGMRVARSSPLFRGGYALGTWLLPFLALTRIVRAVVPKKRYLREFMLSLPFSALAIASWSVGEFWGCLTGVGSSCAHV